GGYAWTSYGAGQFPSSGWGNEIRALRIDPLTPTTLYATSFAGGAFKSTDGGQNWSAILPRSSAVALAVDPQTPTTLYAGRSTGTTTSEILKSTDGGATWTAINHDLGVGTFAIDPQTTATLYAGTSMGVFAIQQTTVGGAVTTTVNFDTPAPPGGQ